MLLEHRCHTSVREVPASQCSAYTTSFDEHVQIMEIVCLRTLYLIAITRTSRVMT